jgi:hypothetical protein
MESKLVMVLSPSSLMSVTVAALKPMRVSASLKVTALAAAFAIIGFLLLSSKQILLIGGWWFQRYVHIALLDTWRACASVQSI